MAKHMVDIQSDTTPSTVNQVDPREKNGIKIAKLFCEEKSQKKKMGKGTNSGIQGGKQIGFLDSKPAKGKKQPPTRHT